MSRDDLTRTQSAPSRRKEMPSLKDKTMLVNHDDVIDQAHRKG
jgi:hypothetical protein